MKRGFGGDFCLLRSRRGNAEIFAPLAVLSEDKSGMLRKTLAIIGYSGFSVKKILTYPPSYFIVKNILRKWKDFHKGQKTLELGLLL